MKTYRHRRRKNIRERYDNVSNLTNEVERILDQYGVEYENNRAVDGYSKDPDTTLELIAGLLCGDGVLRDCVIEVYSDTNITLDWLDDYRRKLPEMYNGSLRDLDAFLNAVAIAPQILWRKR